MFRVFQEEKLITVCMFTFLAGSILLRIFLGMLYRNMIKETDNMASTKNRLLKQCKTKFASCYQLGNGVANIPIFVDKFLNRMTLGRMSFETLYHMSGQLMLLSVVFSGVGVCKSIMGGRTVGEVLPFYIVSFFGLYVYFSVSTVVDVRGKKRVLKINLVDYLENHLSPRIEVTRQDMEMLYGEAAYEERRGPYGRVQGGRGGRGRTRRPGSRGRGQARPERRRTVELMPIDNRMAAGGEMPGEETRDTGFYSGQQQMVQTGQQMLQTDQVMGAPVRMAGQTDLMMQDGRVTGRTAQTPKDPPVGQTLSRQEIQAARQASAEEASLGRQTSLEEASLGRQTSLEEASLGWQTSLEEASLEQEASLAQQAAEIRQMQPLFMEGTPVTEEEDPAAVTEEELEALLKEFLTS